MDNCVVAASAGDHTAVVVAVHGVVQSSNRAVCRNGSTGLSGGVVEVDECHPDLLDEFLAGDAAACIGVVEAAAGIA